MDDLRRQHHIHRLKQADSSTLVAYSSRIMPSLLLTRSLANTPTTMTPFLSTHGYEIARLTFEHLWLTLSAMLLAAAIGLPLGMLLTRRERLAKPVIGAAN